MARMSGERESVSITILNSSHMGSKKAFSFEGRLIWTWATKGRGMETRKYWYVGSEAMVRMVGGVEGRLEEVC